MCTGNVNENALYEWPLRRRKLGRTSTPTELNCFHFLQCMQRGPALAFLTAAPPSFPSLG